MKAPSSTILATLIASAALSLSAVHSKAASSVTIDLSGVTLKSGPTITRASIGSLDAAGAYDYKFTGTVTGKDAAAQVIPPGTPIADALAEFGFFLDSEDGSVDITVFNPGGVLPFNVFDRTGKVSGSSGGFTIKGSAKAKVAILSTGIAKLKLINPKLTLVTPFGPANPGSIVFDQGATATISVTPPASQTAQPDNVILLSENATVGNDIYNANGVNQTEGLTQKRGQAKTYKVAIQNDSTSEDTYTVSSAVTGDAAAFTITYKDGSANVTSTVTAGTYSLASFPSGAVKALTVKVVAKANAAHGATANIAITTTDGTHSDTVVLQPTVK